MEIKKFDSLGLQPKIIKAIHEMDFQTPTEVQEKVIPLLLDSKTNLLALAQTGTGKTAAFGLPLLELVNQKTRLIQGLILTPTRELCLQITNELVIYSKYLDVSVTAVYGGANIMEQSKKLKRNPQIVVATPGRMLDLIRRKLININHIEYCILDEADEMLNMGFYEDITSILSNTSDEKNIWLFSATMPKEIGKIAKTFMVDYQEIVIGKKNISTENVRHEYYIIDRRNRYLALKRLADVNPDIFSVVFCRTKRETQEVAEKLIGDGYNASALHGDLSQAQRDLVMKAFRNNQLQLLIATDVAARGIDVDDITHVINYQLPDDDEVYTHRSGRTGRAGKSGISMILTTKSELRRIRQIEKTINKVFIEKKIPTGIEICEIQLYHLANKIKTTTIQADVEQYLPTIDKLLGNITKEELINKVVSLEFERLFKYYKNSKMLDVSDRGEVSGRPKDKNSSRFFINLGENQGFDWKSMKDFVRQKINKGDVVFNVETKGNFSFFNVEAPYSKKVIDFFESSKFEGQPVRVEKTNKPFKRGGNFKPRSSGSGKPRKHRKHNRPKN